MEDNEFKESTPPSQDGQADDAVGGFSSEHPDPAGGAQPTSSGSTSTQVMYCSRCGAPNAITARFCDRCGSVLVVNSTAAPNMRDPRVYEAVSQGASVPPRYQYGQTPASTQSGKPTGALVCGILSIIFGIFFALVGLILGIIGAVLASNAKKSGMRGSMVTAATVTSVIGIVLSVLAIAGCALIGGAAIQYGLQYGLMGY